MVDQNYDLNDIVEMKKPHPCGANEWKIIRMGMDIRIKCQGCNHSVLVPRKIEKKHKKNYSKKQAKKNVSRETFFNFLVIFVQTEANRPLFFIFLITCVFTFINL